MIKELADFGKRLRIEKKILEDALDNEHVDIIIEIDKEGKFNQIYPTDKETLVEDVIRTMDAGRTSGIVPRLLVDNAQYILGYPSDKKRSIECMDKFIEKLKMFSEISELKPVFNFYSKDTGIKAAIDNFSLKVRNKEIDEKGNIAFWVQDDDRLIHEHDSVYQAIIEKYIQEENKRKGKDKTRCSICGRTDYRAKNVSVHGVIKKVPNGQQSGCSLISYNEDSFESYKLKGNDNSSICTNCIKNYTFGLKHLLKSEKHRKNFGSDTAVVFWTREPEPLDEMDWFDKPDAGQVANLIESVANAKYKTAQYFKPNQFYSLTLSGEAARIAVHDWIEISIDQYRQNIAQWFDDVKIKYFVSDSKELKLFYPALHKLSNSCNRRKAKDDPTASRVAKYLWACAIKNQAPPLWILPIVLKRIAHNETTSEGKSVNTFTNDRASLLKLILNRNNYGGIKMKETLDFENMAPAYLCGRLFSLIEGIQRAALGKKVNAGVRERFFAAASTSPSPTFGRLLRNMQNHLTKVRQEKPGLAIVLEKEVTELCSKIQSFPATLSLEQQGQFALGYYHQKHHNFYRASQNKEFEPITENMEESENE